MSYLSLLVLLLAVITLAIARNPTPPNHQNLHEEVAAGSNGLINYQSPTTDPQKLVALNCDGPTTESSKFSIGGLPIVIPVVRFPNIPHLFHGRPRRPPP
ncbi:hypothetical protein QL285_035930 [Trifolium repens]|nr:hypothetical protein QL285_035930 [Trifolium repens]